MTDRATPDDRPAPAQDGEHDIGSNEDDERAERRHFEQTGEQPTDALGNADGAS